MPGEEPTSVPDLIQGEWETRQGYLAGGRLKPSESLAADRRSEHGFGWGDGGSGAAQLALAPPLRATDAETRRASDGRRRGACRANR